MTHPLCLADKATESCGRCLCDWTLDVIFPLFRGRRSCWRCARWATLLRTTYRRAGLCLLWKLGDGDDRNRYGCDRCIYRRLSPVTRSTPSECIVGGTAWLLLVRTWYWDTWSCIEMLGGRIRAADCLVPCRWRMCTLRFHHNFDIIFFFL